MDDASYDGDPEGFVGHQAIEEDDEVSGVCSGDVSTSDGGGGFMGEVNGRCGDLFGDSHGLERQCHFQGR